MINSDHMAISACGGRRDWLVCLAALPLATALGFALVAHSNRWVLAPAGLAVVAVVLWRPYLGYLVAVATLPADALGILGGGDSPVVLTAAKVAGVLTLVAWGADILYRRHLPRGKRFLTVPTAVAMLFFALNVLSAVAHPSEESAAEVGRLLTILVFVFVSIHFMDRPERVMHVVVAMVVMATLVAAQSVLQRGSGEVMLSEEWAAGAGAVLDVGEEALGAMLRTSGTFSHPAWLGLFLSLVLPLTLFVVFASRRRAISLLALGAAVLQILGVFSTYSRMAYIGVALGVALTALRRRFGVALLLGMIACTAMIYPALPADIRARASSIVRYSESSSSLTRIGQQLAGFAMLRDHALLGVGPGNFEKEVVNYEDKVGEPYQVQPIGAHNLYVEVAAELGVVGLLLVLALLGVALRDARRLRLAALKAGNVRLAMLWESLFTSLIVFSVSALFVHAQYRKEWWVVISLIAAGQTMAGVQRQTAAQGEV